MDGKTARAVYCSQKCSDAFYRQANAKVIAEQKRQYQKANAERRAEYQREYHQANRERSIERMRKYGQANRERIAARNREYQKANAERRAEYQREYINNRIAAASILSLAHTVFQIRGDLTNGTHEPE